MSACKWYVYLVFKSMEIVTKQILKHLAKPEGVNEKRAPLC